MKIKIALLILLIASIVNAETFVKRFSYIMECPYMSYNNSYMDNCETSVQANSLFIFNYDNSSDVLWITSDGTKYRLYNVGRTFATTNDDGDSVYIYNFFTNNGANIELIWQGSWLRVLFPLSRLFEFSNVYHNNDTDDDTDDDEIDI